jgi:gas vesicle protein
MQKNTTILGVLAGLGAGAATMYFLDPDRGAGRRALVSDKFSSAVNQLPEAARVTKQDLANRAQGFWYETRNLFAKNKVASDENYPGARAF